MAVGSACTVGRVMDLLAEALVWGMLLGIISLLIPRPAGGR